MRAAEFAVATKMHELLKEKPKIANPLFPGMLLVHNSIEYVEANYIYIVYYSTTYSIL